MREHDSYTVIVTNPDDDTTCYAAEWEVGTGTELVRAAHTALARMVRGLGHGGLIVTIDYHTAWPEK